jgi:hypothetical protein
MGRWLVDSANTLLNYVPIFLILFAAIAIIEDTGYMARIAFILDKILHRFGLHGQSTLPLILGGVFAGGCAVPGVMATKGIPYERARMATIFAVPFMNCPRYVGVEVYVAREGSGSPDDHVFTIGKTMPAWRPNRPLIEPRAQPLHRGSHVRRCIPGQAAKTAGPAALCVRAPRGRDRPSHGERFPTHRPGCRETRRYPSDAGQAAYRDAVLRVVLDAGGIAALSLGVHGVTPAFSRNARAASTRH